MTIVIPEWVLIGLSIWFALGVVWTIFWAWLSHQMNPKGYR